MNTIAGCGADQGQGYRRKDPITRSNGSFDCMGSPRTPLFARKSLRDSQKDNHQQYFSDLFYISGSVRAPLKTKQSLPSFFHPITHQMISLPQTGAMTAMSALVAIASLRDSGPIFLCLNLGLAYTHLRSKPYKTKTLNQNRRRKQNEK